jgi:Ribosome biogenesis protein Nop16
VILRRCQWQASLTVDKSSKPTNTAYLELYRYLGQCTHLVNWQNRTWNRFDPNPKVNSLLKLHWDPSQTPAANLTRLGLVAHPNQAESSKAKTSIRRTVALEESFGTSSPSAPATAVIELFDVPDSDAPSRRCRFPLDEEEERYMVKCIAKWGDNYTRMFRDLKVNPMQHTEDKLRKLGSRFLLLSPDQRRIEVPSNVRHLLPGTSAHREVD